MIANRLRVGVQYTPGPEHDLNDLVAAGQECEAMGYDCFSLPDHLSRREGGHAVALPDPVVLLARLAAETSTIGLGTMTLLDSLRHPAQTVRTAATLQQVTGDRFELGLGAGWLGSDLAALDIGVSDRVKHLERTLALFRHAWPSALTTTSATSRPQEEQGAAEQAVVANAVGVRAPRLVVAAGGPRMLRLAARAADVVALTVPTRHRHDGTRPTSVSVATQIDTARRARPAGQPTPVFHLQIRDLPQAAPVAQDADWWTLGGSPAQAAEALRARCAAGIGYLSVCSQDLRVLERLASRVLPLLDENRP
ncbi:MULTISPECIES: LLM class flavin-dependent oxidoreductase [Actinosynnema]|uniref:LLM class flavin-dependent oxidoreductase n=1 Tax=Actinosynnema TaxID=40566 RepID=UPI0020A49CE4|nr:LLM class flavin-dependent oxidoreductase [Actinosynnema pretiosum]MCP2098089.1 Luciferase-like monooxygenase [Actinosynnema pretiosum]